MPEKKLYRSRDSLLGGVCKGIAEYFNIDPIVVQILTVILTIATAGVAGIAYVALWIIIPPTPDPNAPVDVDAHEVHSDTYGQVNYATEKPAGASAATASGVSSGETYVGCAHIPPEPPCAPEGSQQPTETYAASAQAYAATAPVPPVEPGTETPPSGDPVYAAQPQTPHQAPQPNPIPPQGAPKSAASSPCAPQAPSNASSGALWVGFTLLFVGIAALLGVFVEGVEWWQFWPLMFVIFGIGHMIVPGKKGHRMERFVNGLTSFSFGVAALPFSLGLFATSSLIPIFTNLWPLLIIMCGLYVLGEALKAPLITLLGGLAFVAFCVIAIGWFATPGPTDMLSMTLWNGRTYVYDLNMWAW